MPEDVARLISKVVVREEFAKGKAAEAALHAGCTSTAQTSVPDTRSYHKKNLSMDTYSVHGHFCPWTEFFFILIQNRTSRTEIF
jgi:hypothetical protein